MSMCYRVRCWVPSGQSRPNPSPNPNPNQVLGTKWTWAKIAGLAFNENGALKTPWGVGKQGGVLKPPSC